VVEKTTDILVGTKNLAIASWDKTAEVFRGLEESILNIGDAIGSNT